MKKSIKINSIVFGVFLLSLCVLVGFDFSRHSISLEEIQSGGPVKDGIPALTDPKLLTADEASYLRPLDRVIGFVYDGQARAYPIRILNWHEVVNDVVGGSPVAIVYCPLCGSGTVFDARVNGTRSTFGVSGKLYNSDVLIYDHATESLWSQLLMEAVTGPLTGTHLTLLDARHTTWQAWREQYPDTRVLSLETGYDRDYDRDPYQGYIQRRDIFFPVAHQDDRFHPKEWVLGVKTATQIKAYPFSELRKQSSSFLDDVGEREITVHFDSESESAWVTTSDEEPIVVIQAYWFAWVAFYPETDVYIATAGPEEAGGRLAG